jgi:hypothetical protein
MNNINFILDLNFRKPSLPLHSIVQLSTAAHIIRTASACIIAVAVMTVFDLQPAEAWGRRGHHIIADNAGQILSQHFASDKKPSPASPQISGSIAIGSAEASQLGGESELFREHSYDLGYYSNVPDVGWKKPATYEVEWTNHFMDLEIFQREFAKLKAEDKIKNYSLSRIEFDKLFPDIPQKAGRSFWRILEMFAQLETIRDQLKKSEPTEKETIAKHHRLQKEWLVLAGTMSHYIGDLSQPLHATENYDGQSTDQKGVHAFFEDTCVDVLGPKIAADALLLSQKNWQKYHAAHREKPVIVLLLDLAEDSLRKVPELLAIDKKAGRKSPAKSAQANRELILARISKGSLVIAEIWSRALGWKYHGAKFYDFVGEPEYIKPGIPLGMTAPTATTSGTAL